MGMTARRGRVGAMELEDFEGAATELASDGNEFAAMICAQLLVAGGDEAARQKVADDWAAKCDAMVPVIYNVVDSLGSIGAAIERCGKMFADWNDLLIERAFRPQGLWLSDSIYSYDAARVRAIADEEILAWREILEGARTKP